MATADLELITTSVEEGARLIERSRIGLRYRVDDGSSQHLKVRRFVLRRLRVKSLDAIHLFSVTLGSQRRLKQLNRIAVRIF